MAALDALLPHPDEARVHRQVKAGGAGAEHDHAAALDDEAAHREGLLARMLEHEIDVVALARDLPDRLSEFADLLHVLGIAGIFVAVRQASPQGAVFSVDPALASTTHTENTR